MKFANLRENRDNGKRWEWETALRLLNSQTHYPPGCNNYNAFVDMSWKDAHIKRTFYDARANYTEPSLPIGTTMRVMGGSSPLSDTPSETTRLILLLQTDSTKSYVIKSTTQRSFFKTHTCNYTCRDCVQVC
jgi:hypothetical protein